MSTIVPLDAPVALTPSAKAAKAIHYTLRRIRREPTLAYRFLGTEAHELLINAYGALTNTDPETVRCDYQPQDSFCCRACNEKEGQ
jgi:hypothetical protein